MKERTTLMIRILVAVFIILLSGNQIFAQQDSIIYESENKSASDIYYKHKYQYLDIRLGDQTKLLKFAAQPFKPSKFYDFSVLTLQAAYEKKLSPSFSFVSEINASINNLDSANVNITSFALGFRYYDNMKLRIARGVSGNNCNGYYIGLKANILRSTAYKDLKKGLPFDRTIDWMDPTPEVSMGIQQRFTRLFYVDASLFANYSLYDGFGYGVTVLLGISFNIED